MPGSLPQLVGDWGWCSPMVLGCGALVVAGWPLLGGSGYRAWGPGSRGLWLRPFLRGVGLRPLGWGGLSQVRKHTLLVQLVPDPDQGVLSFSCVCPKTHLNTPVYCLGWRPRTGWCHCRPYTPRGWVWEMGVPTEPVTHPHTLSLIQHMHA